MTADVAGKDLKMMSYWDHRGFKRSCAVSRIWEQVSMQSKKVEKPSANVHGLLLQIQRPAFKQPR